ncbi:ABC transporter substrate-binding protein, partial [bacterium]|nr:ABC transporter substrate-binding protein [bacterium]
DITNPKPGAAESFKASPDGMEYTFTLRKGIKFSSGNPMTAKDVKWSFERAKNIKGNPSFLLEDIQSVEAPDDQTVVIKMSKGDGAFLYKLTSQPFAILDSETVKKNGGVADESAVTADTANEWLTSHSAGSGPFMIESYKPNDEVVLVKNPNYWGKPAAVDKVILKTMKDSNTQMLTLAKGDIDVAASLNYDQIKQLQGKPNVEIKNYETLSMMFVLTNLDPAIGGPLANVDVQNAIRYALDYKGIHTLVGEGTITPQSMIQVGFLGALPALDPNFTNLDKAKELLAKAGYPDGFSTTMEVVTNSTEGVKWVAMAQKVQEDLSKVGIKAEIKTMDTTVGYERYRGGKMPLTVMAWG